MSQSLIAKYMSKIFTINNYEVIGNYFGFLTSLWEMWQLNTLKLDIKLFKECLKLQTSVRKSFGSEILIHFVLWIDLPVELMSHLTYEPMDNALQIFAFCNCSCGWFLFFSKASLTLTCWLCNCLKILLSCDMRQETFCQIIVQC